MSEKAERGKIMFCQKCGNEMAEGSSFCIKCGAKVGETKIQSENSAAATTVAPKKIKNIFSIIGTILILCIFVLPALGIKNPISNAAGDILADTLNEGKGTSELEVLVDAYLTARKNCDISALEKYLDESLNYPNLKKIIETDSKLFEKINISKAEYSIVREYTVNGTECVEIKYSVSGEGWLIGKIDNGVVGTMYAHKAGKDNLWFYGAPAE